MSHSTTEHRLNPEIRRAIQRADKYIRKKKYQCLYPGCGKMAIRCHAIPRASLIEAIAKNGKLYSLNQSYTSTYRMTSPHDPMEVVEVGVNQAGVFKGFCPEHDTKLFTPIETTDEDKKKAVAISCHLRALALEHSRKQRNVDYYKKFVEFDLPAEFRDFVIKNIVKPNELGLALVESYLGSLFFPEHHGRSGGIDYWGLPFSKNLGVSCCGIFNHNNDLNPDSVIGYTLICYRDLSILLLTTFANEHVTLDPFVRSYGGAVGIQRMVNDIAFLKGEEPLISAALWESLSDSEKYETRLSLVHPSYRLVNTSPNIIEVTPDDMLKGSTPEFVAKVGKLSPYLYTHSLLGNRNEKPRTRRGFP